MKSVVLSANEEDMPFTLPNLPFDPKALEPWTSAETLSYHHGRHHAAYVAKLNAAIAGTDYDGLTLEDIVVASRGKNPAVFVNAAQHWNHSFFWGCLSPWGRQFMSVKLADLVTQRFGTPEAFGKAFSDAAARLFGSGWVWLVQEADGTLEILQTNDADNPLVFGQTALLTLDVWEHAYYIDHRNDRAKYIEGFWRHVHWRAVAARLR